MRVHMLSQRETTRSMTAAISMSMKNCHWKNVYRNVMELNIAPQPPMRSTLNAMKMPIYIRCAIRAAFHPYMNRKISSERKIGRLTHKNDPRHEQDSDRNVQTTVEHHEFSELTKYSIAQLVDPKGDRDKGEEEQKLKHR
jgi:hypothetical protein